MVCVLVGAPGGVCVWVRICSPVQLQLSAEYVDALYIYCLVHGCIVHLIRYDLVLYTPS